MTLEGNAVPLDALDYLDALSRLLATYPNDAAAREAIRERLARMQQEDDSAPFESHVWGGDVPPQREWLVTDTLPAGRVALLSGQGGAGKSRLALQLAAGIASGGGEGNAWIDGPAEVMRLGNAVSTEGACVIYASWEDEDEEFDRRLSEISGPAAPWVTPARLGNLRFMDMAGHGPVWAPQLHGSRHVATIAEITDTGRKLRAHCEEHGARLLVIDPLAAAYASDENNRGLVRSFVADWDAWGRAKRCAVLLLAHPPKSGAGYAGSTDWEAATRSLWTLAKQKRGNAPPWSWHRQPCRRVEAGAGEGQLLGHETRAAHGLGQHRRWSQVADRGKVGCKR